jgi:Protein of unknown function (DUF3551)
MRISALAILAVLAVSVTGSATAQTYDPNYPVCMKVLGTLNYFDCSFTSLPQCAASASGRAAECVINPYQANALAQPSGPRHQRQRRPY